MVAYNFKERFADAIRTGDKTHTIRRNGKRRHARKGEPIQLYTGLRTKAAAKILEPDPICVDVLPIEIAIEGVFITSVKVGGVPIPNLRRFAIADGFRSVAEMSDFFRRQHGRGVFQGSLIEWRRRDA